MSMVDAIILHLKKQTMSVFIFFKTCFKITFGQSENNDLVTFDVKYPKIRKNCFSSVSHLQKSAKILDVMAEKRLK